MSRQPAQRTVFEDLRRQSEALRVDEIAASDTLNLRNTEALMAAEVARAQAAAALVAAQAALDAANQAAGAAATAGAASTAATNAIADANASVNAANGAVGAANAAVASANDRMAFLSRSTVAQVISAKDEIAPDTSWNTKPGLSLSGAWGGLIAVVRVSVPCDSTGAGAITRRQYFELRRDGIPVASREVTQMPSTMTMTYAERLAPGSHDYTLWWRSGGDGFIGASGPDEHVPRRTMTATLVAG